MLGSTGAQLGGLQLGGIRIDVFVVLLLSANISRTATLYAQIERDLYLGSSVTTSLAVNVEVVRILNRLVQLNSFLSLNATVKR